VLIKKDKGLTREGLLEAISQGHCYLSFDLFGDAKGFMFAPTGTEPKIMGDEIAYTYGLVLKVSAPLNCRLVLWKNGTAIDQKSGASVDFSIYGPGSYRVEAYVDSLPSPVKGQPWIISNPIYVIPSMTQINPWPTQKPQ
jgi:hypothetical protein